MTCLYGRRGNNFGSMVGWARGLVSETSEETSRRRKNKTVTVKGKNRLLGYKGRLGVARGIWVNLGRIEMSNKLWIERANPKKSKVNKYSVEAYLST